MAHHHHVAAHGLGDERADSLGVVVEHPAVVERHLVAGREDGQVVAASDDGQVIVAQGAASVAGAHFGHGEFHVAAAAPALARGHAQEHLGALCVGVHGVAYVIVLLLLVGVVNEREELAVRAEEGSVDACLAGLEALVAVGELASAGFGRGECHLGLAEVDVELIVVGDADDA